MELKQLFNTYNSYVDLLEQFLSKTYAVPEITLVKYDDNDVHICFYYGDTLNQEFTTISFPVKTFEKLIGVI